MLRVRKELIQLLRKAQAESITLSNNRQLPLPLMRMRLKAMVRGERLPKIINHGVLSKILFSKTNTLSQPNKDKICHSLLMKIFKKEFLDKIISKECNNNRFGGRTKTSLLLLLNLKIHLVATAQSCSLTEVISTDSKLQTWLQTSKSLERLDKP